MMVRWPRLLTPTHLSQIIRNQKNPLTALQIFNETKSKYPNYRHNGPVYAAMVNILGSSGRIAEMKEVIHQMRDDSCECKDSIFVTAIKIYAKAGLIDEAISLFKNIPQFNCVNWTESFNTLLQIVVKESRLENAHQIFVENCCGWEVKSRIRSLNLLMDCLCHCRRPDLALEIFQEMYYQGCYPNRDSYHVLMKGLCDGGRLYEATHLLYSMFWRISLKGSGEDIVVYRTLLNALCDNGKVEEAVEILGKILRKGLKAPNRCRHRLDFSYLSSGNDIEGTKFLINEALVKGAIPSLTSYSAMAVDFYNEGKIAEADKVFDEMLHRGFRPSMVIYEAKVAALCKEGLMGDAVRVIEEEFMEGNCVPSVKLYNIVMKGLCDAGHSAMAVGYLDNMAKQVGCVADKETYGILVNGLCREGKFEEASRVLEKMLIKSYWPSVQTYNMIITGLCSIGRQYDSVMWLEEMVSEGKVPQSFIWNSLVSSYISSNKPNIDVCNFS